MDLKQLHQFVVIPTLRILGCEGKGAERLVLGTGLTESGLQFISQVPSGVAKGLYQMEKATHDDIHKNYLAFNGDLLQRVMSLSLQKWGDDQYLEMQGNLYYATAMCRIHYKRVPKALPNGYDLEDMAKYWKEHYNTSQGAGKIEDFMKKAKAVMDL